ncbi:MAG: CotH kinase family protein, partial [Bacillota bacterium]|nr:CotH kinase family protein [Bacillota bacterium]
VFTNSTTTASTQVNAAVTLNSAATISGGTTPTYQTTCSNQNVTIGSATTASPTVTATAAGTYTVVTTATNPNTNETATKTYTVTVTAVAVTITFNDSTTTATAQPGATITLNSAATISDNTTPTYLTTCSDPSVTIGSATTDSPTFTSSVTGTYTVVTTATNPNTNQTATKTYTVTVSTSVTSTVTVKDTITPASGLVGDNFQIVTYVNKFANAVSGVSYTYVLTVKVDGTECTYVNSNNITTALKQTITAQYTPTTQGTKNVSIAAIAYTDYGTSSQAIAATGSTTATLQVAKYPASFAEDNRIYARAVAGSSDMDSWSAAEDASISYSSSDTSVVPSLGSTNASNLRIFLPTTASATQVEVLNTYSSSITIGTTEIQAGRTAPISYTPGTAQNLVIGTTTRTITFYKSTTEGALYVNDASRTASQMVTQLYSDKVTGAISSITGGVASGSTSSSVAVKSIKGRGNTTWTNTGKKSFNVSYSSAVTVAGLTGTKFSLLANFQDPSLARNRMILDLADQAGVNYSSDSRFVDLYLDGLYMGSYLMTQKVEIGTGKNYVVGDVDALNYDNITTASQVPTNFNFLMEVDSNASDADGDFWVQSAVTANKLTIHAPEYLASSLGTSYHDDVATAIKNNVRDKFDAMYTALATNASNLSDYIDVDSFTRYYLANELVKNYDIGVTSTYFVYKQDASGNWKFFASPMWDYDNAMGNCAGDGASYQSYENDWTSTKSYPSNQNIMSKVAVNTTIQAAAPEIWFDYFCPAISNLSSTSSTYSSSVHLQSTNYYITSLSDSFTNNYRKWSLLNNNGWVTAHSSLTKATFNNSTDTYTVDSTPTTYNINTAAGQINYAVDWLTSRAAWMSQKYYIIGTVPVFSNGTTAYNTYTNTALTLNSTAAVSSGTISYNTSCSDSNVTITGATNAQPVFTASATGSYTVTTTATNTSTSEVNTKTYTITVSTQPTYANYYLTGPGAGQSWGTWTQMSLSSDGTYAYAQISAGTEFKISNTASYDNYTGLSIDSTLNQGATLTGSLASGAGTNLSAAVSSGYTTPLYICVDVSTGKVYVKATAQ